MSDYTDWIEDVIQRNGGASGPKQPGDAAPVTQGPVTPEPAPATPGPATDTQPPNPGTQGPPLGVNQLLTLVQNLQVHSIIGRYNPTNQMFL